MPGGPGKVPSGGGRKNEILQARFRTFVRYIRKRKR